MPCKWLREGLDSEWEPLALASLRSLWKDKWDKAFAGIWVVASPRAEGYAMREESLLLTFLCFWAPCDSMLATSWEDASPSSGDSMQSITVTFSVYVVYKLLNKQKIKILFFRTVEDQNLYTPHIYTHLMQAVTGICFPVQFFSPLQNSQELVL